MLKRLPNASESITAIEPGVPRCAVFVMACVAAFFIIATAICHLLFGSGTANLMGFHQIIDVDSEANLPTWYSAALLHFAALLAWMIAWRDGEDNVQWRIIAFLLLVMGIDEIASLHNSPSRRLGDWIGINEGFLMNAWVIPGALVCICVAIGFTRFLLRQPRWLARGLFIAATLYITGALVLEVAGTIVEFNAAGFQYDGDKNYSLGFELIAVTEELFEYAGVILTISLFLRRAREVNASFSFAP